MKVQHYALLAAILGGIGAQIAALPSWDAITPAFIGATLVALGSAVAGVFVNAPRDPSATTRAADRRRGGE